MQARGRPLADVAILTDKNRIAIQGDVLGAAAMGVCNIMCLTGDGVQAGDQPGAKPVFDLDSISLLSLTRRPISSTDADNSSVADATDCMLVEASSEAPAT